MTGRQPNPGAGAAPYPSAGTGFRCTRHIPVGGLCPNHLAGRRYGRDQGDVRRSTYALREATCSAVPATGGISPGGCVALRCRSTKRPYPATLSQKNLRDGGDLIMADQHNPPLVSGATLAFSALGGGDTLRSRCAHYRSDWGLPAVVQPELDRIIVTASSKLTSVTMPAELGARVRHRLQHGGGQAGPIVLLARSVRWSFLARPGIALDTSIDAELFGLYVSVAVPSTVIVLPGPTGSHLRSWVRPPTDEYLPRVSVVLDAVRACTRPSSERRLAIA